MQCASIVVTNKQATNCRKQPHFREYGSSHQIRGGGGDNKVFQTVGNNHTLGSISASSHHRPGGEVIRSSSREWGFASSCPVNCEGTCVVDDDAMYVMAGGANNRTHKPPQTSLHQSIKMLLLGFITSALLGSSVTTVVGGCRCKAS